jgi:hypothetical protein
MSGKIWTFKRAKRYDVAHSGENGHRQTLAMSSAIGDDSGLRMLPPLPGIPAAVWSLDDEGLAFDVGTDGRNASLCVARRDGPTQTTLGKLARARRTGASSRLSPG